MRPAHIPDYDARVDWLMIAYLAIVALIILVFHARVAGWGFFFLGHAAAIAILLRAIRIGREGRGRAFRWLLYWYPALMLVPLFIELSYLIHPVHPRDYDHALALLDRRWFGVDPVLWLQQISRPWLTEILQLAYTSFYLFPLGLLFALYFSKRLVDFRHAQFGMLLSFYLSYFGYFVVPALGPRFMDQGPPPGLFLSRVIQESLNHLERAGAMRDAFPSGHVAVALVVQWYAFRCFRHRGFWLLPLTLALIFSTVYLGYHYAVDVVAGVVLALFCILITAWIESGDRRSGNIGRERGGT